MILRPLSLRNRALLGSVYERRGGDLHLMHYSITFESPASVPYVLQEEGIQSSVAERFARMQYSAKRGRM